MEEETVGRGGGVRQRKKGKSRIKKGTATSGHA